MILNIDDQVPESVMVMTGNGVQKLSRSGSTFGHADIAVEFIAGEKGKNVRLASPTHGINQIICRWSVDVIDDVRILNDHWERGYGDLEWRGYSTYRMLPWYFLVNDGTRTCGTGVMVQPNAFCYWELTPRELILVCDVRNGAEPVQLGKRQLDVCTIVSEIYENQSPFTAACAFCKRLSPVSLAPQQAVYGFNDWYYIYGKNSADTVRRDTETLASLTEGLENRPYSVLDAGWHLNDGNGCSGGPLLPNRKFGDMKALSDDIKKMGVRSGIWMRPLMTSELLPDGVKIDSKLLDPSHPEALRYIDESIRLLVDDWGYDLVKHDFSTFDIFGKWGFEMLGHLTGPKTLRFQDKSRTTAEIILDVYRTIRKAAGKAAVIGCNTVSHLAAGLVELQRTGDDTSGKDWARTLKMGVNTLAFRMPQHEAFYAVDADCVGLTDQVPWQLNRQWLDLLAKSGTPLFVSADPEALGAEQRGALKDAFAFASAKHQVAEPVDWLDNTLPQVWRIEGETVRYDWYSEAPVPWLFANDNVFK